MSRIDFECSILHHHSVLRMDYPRMEFLSLANQLIVNVAANEWMPGQTCTNSTKRTRKSLRGHTNSGFHPLSYFTEPLISLCLSCQWKVCFIPSQADTRQLMVAMLHNWQRQSLSGRLRYGTFSEQSWDVQHDVDDRIGFNNAILSWSNEAGMELKRHRPEPKAACWGQPDIQTELHQSHHRSNVTFLSLINVIRVQSFHLPKRFVIWFVLCQPSLPAHPTSTWIYLPISTR